MLFFFRLIFVLDATTFVFTCRLQMMVSAKFTNYEAYICQFLYLCFVNMHAGGEYNLISNVSFTPILAKGLHRLYLAIFSK